MKFLAPTGGFTDERFGILTTPGMRGIPSGIKAGLSWAADNQVYTKEFNPARFFHWLQSMEPYRPTCLFVSCPDVVGNAQETLKLFDEYHERFQGWPVAFVCQDGQEDLEFPDPELWSCLFIGGSTDWKLSDAAKGCIKKAQALGKHIHVGRINRFKRYKHFADLDGSNDFTCDGTRIRYERTKCIEDWIKYMEYKKEVK